MPPTPQDRVAFDQYSNVVSSSVYDGVLDKDVPGVATQLESSNDVNALAEGLRYPPERREELLKKTEQREGDTDVVTIKAVAQAVLSSREYYKLAQVLTVAVYPEGGCLVRLLLIVRHENF